MEDGDDPLPEGGERGGQIEGLTALCGPDAAQGEDPAAAAGRAGKVELFAA